ncbi:hypothetical protein NHX12_008194 [Muraenolepis orangiensis]|uniref:DNA-directed RNA polymerase I subunit RPA34 n=1 Tax=Muraenolepis orangiensis TaxID=630683 RepID=A0A9Q0DNE0_9TELE|nr:hypothetical protein NHX12_008194 [Muraenolepis orangiensis]
MSSDTSNSSSEDEENSPTTAPTSLPKRKVMKHNAYKCPDDFVSFTHKPCSSTLANSLKNTNSELWLIKAPASFNPERFNGVAVPLSGLQTVRVAAEGSAPHCLYSVLGSTRTPADLRLLTADGPASDQSVVCGPAFSGVLNVCQLDAGEGALLRRPQTIPAAPRPAAPPGLKQRFLPFGSKMPTLTCVAESELEADAAGPSSATLRPLVVKHFPMEEDMTEEERRRERKRRRKERRIKTEILDPVGVAMAEVKMEAIGKEEGEGEEEGQSMEAGLPFREEGGTMEERRKKKKKRKKDKGKERVVTQALEEKKEEEVEAGYGEVKCEAVDLAYEDIEGSAKKKKKKRKIKVDEA